MHDKSREAEQPNVRSPSFVLVGMTTTIAAQPKSPWLVGASALALLAIAILWPVQTAAQPCIAIYPAPPGCGSAGSPWFAYVAIGLIVALLAAIFIAAFTMASPRVTMMILIATIGAVLIVGFAASAMAQSGVWDAPIPIDPLILE